MSDVICHKVFQKSVNYYYTVLKKGYLKEIEDASDQEYAKRFYQRILFLENEMVPYQSIVFRELEFTFHHFNCLRPKIAIEKTFELLEQIKTVGKKRLNEAIKHLSGDQNIHLDEWYLEQIDSGKANLEELVLIEAKALEASAENLMASLALSVAGKKLYQEYRNTNEPTSKIESKNHLFQFTRNEQVLALYFIMQSFGLNLYQICDRTKFAALFHLVMGVPFDSKSKIKDLSIYKSLSSAPYVVSNHKSLLKYLQNIRPFFEEANLLDATKLIDKEIKMCQSAIDQ